MSVELLNTLSLVAYIIAGVLFLISTALFFLLNVPKLIGDISGATARKAIEAIRRQNESTDEKAYQPSPVNAARGKLTDEISPSGRVERRTDGIGIGARTEKFGTLELWEAAQTTALLDNGDETAVLNQGESEATTLLSEQEAWQPKAQKPAVCASVTVEVELGFAGSTELIE